METRPYFVLGDVSANLLVGAFTGGIMAVVFDPQWNIFLAMVVGMALGIVLSLPLTLVAGALFGAMEVMLPVMTTGMLTGMVVAVAAVMAPHTFTDGALLGAISGSAVLVLTYIANTIIKRKASRWTP